MSANHPLLAVPLPSTVDTHGAALATFERGSAEEKIIQVTPSMARGYPLGNCCYPIRDSSFRRRRIALRQEFDHTLQVFVRLLV